MDREGYSYVRDTPVPEINIYRLRDLGRNQGSCLVLSYLSQLIRLHNLDYESKE